MVDKTQQLNDKCISKLLRLHSLLFWIPLHVPYLAL